MKSNSGGLIINHLSWSFCFCFFSLFFLWITIMEGRSNDTRRGGGLVISQEFSRKRLLR